MTRKSLAILAAALIPLASPVAADVDYIISQNFNDSGFRVDLPMVRSAGPGVVRAFDIPSGRLLDEVAVRPGANSSVALTFAAKVDRDFLAVLFRDGQPVFEERINIRR